MARHNRLPWDLLTKTVRKTPAEVYDSLLDRKLLSPAGQTDRAEVIRRINVLFSSMDSTSTHDAYDSPYAKEEEAFLASGYITGQPQLNAPLQTSSSWPHGNISDTELPDGYEIVKYFSPHVARARINRSGTEDGTIVEVLLKKCFGEEHHELAILTHLLQQWVEENGHNTRPPFPTEAKPLTDDLFEEEFIYSRPLVPTPDEHPEPVFKRIEPLLEAVEWIHKHDVIHGDLNINNVLVTSATIRLIDFGNARCPGINESWFRSATPLYRAPEAFEAPPSIQMDIFSLGATLHRLFFGSLPYDEHYQAKPCRHPMQPKLKKVLDTATRLKPTERYQRVEDLHQDLLKVLTQD